MPFLDGQCWCEIDDASRHARPKTSAIFLDRDGVIIVEKNYLSDPAQVDLYPGVADKIGSLRKLGLPIVVVTNQSGIGQGLFGWAEYSLVHQRMVDLLKIEQPFSAVYANSHTSAELGAAWRKPNPGMLLQASRDLNICLETSIMVGDKLVDMEAAARAGVKHLIHVKTGHGVSERPKVIMHCPQAELSDSLAHIDFDFLCRNETG